MRQQAISGTQPRKNMIMGKVDTSDLIMIITWAMDISSQSPKLKWASWMWNVYATQYVTLPWGQDKKYSWWYQYWNSLVQGWGNCSALAPELPQSCTKPLISYMIWFSQHCAACCIMLYWVAYFYINPYAMDTNNVKYWVNIEHSW